MKVEVIILNFNGGELLLDCMPSLVSSVKKSRHDASLVILDNLSTDGSDEEIRKKFPSVKVVRARENRVLCSYNEYLESSDCEVALLLNNDIRVDEDFIDPLIRHFEEDPAVFMVTPKCMSYEGDKFEGGITRFRMKYGIFWASSRYEGYEKDIEQVHATMAAGYGAFERKKFLALGGYDDLYLPGRLEDSDICFRAWKKGWKLLYEPASVVYHKGGVSFHKKFGEFNTLKINHRNSFLFTWKNISDPVYLIPHLFFLPLRLLFALVKGNKSFVLGFFDALPLLGQALKKRSQVPVSVMTDREVFQKV